MKTEHLLVEALKEMMSEVPLDTISVSTLAERCGINRKTFYYHYQDIYDLLAQTFLEEKVEGIQNVNNPQELISVLFKYYTKNRKFIDATLDSAGRDLFREFVNSQCYLSFMKQINKLPNAKKVHINDRKAIVRFYSAGYSNSIVFYLTNIKNKSVDGLLKSVSFLGEDFLSDALENVINLGKKS